MIILLLAMPKHHYAQGVRVVSAVSLGRPAYCAIRNKNDQHFWGPGPALSSFLTLYGPIPRFLKGVFEHKNTLMEVQPGHTLYLV